MLIRSLSLLALPTLLSMAPSANAHTLSEAELAQVQATGQEVARQATSTEAPVTIVGLSRGDTVYQPVKFVSDGKGGMTSIPLGIAYTQSSTGGAIKKLALPKNIQVVPFASIGAERAQRLNGTFGVAIGIVDRDATGRDKIQLNGLVASGGVGLGGLEASVGFGHFDWENGRTKGGGTITMTYLNNTSGLGMSKPGTQYLGAQGTVQFSGGFGVMLGQAWATGKTGGAPYTNAGIFWRIARAPKM